jgi:PTH1 family peptidyl-tRNA hydrolase
MPAQASIELIVGLGNPGARYERTRHNAGFWWVDAIARRLNATWAFEGRYEAMLARVRSPSSDLWLLKPQTFMNLSGKSVAALANFHRIAPDRLLVVHDELDLPVGRARMKRGGGTAGHNGLTDIAEKLGSKDFWRLRLGIGHPGHKDLVAGYVLGMAPADEQRALVAMVETAEGLLPYLTDGRVQDGVTWLHTAFSPPRPPRPPRPAPAEAPPTSTPSTTE